MKIQLRGCWIRFLALKLPMIPMVGALPAAPQQGFLPLALM